MVCVSDSCGVFVVVDMWVDGGGGGSTSVFTILFFSLSDEEEEEAQSEPEERAPAPSARKKKGGRAALTTAQMFDTLYTRKTAVEEEANAWIEFYKRDSKNALAVLINALVRMCGCKGPDFTLEQFEDEEVCVCVCARASASVCGCECVRACLFRCVRRGLRAFRLCLLCRTLLQLACLHRECYVCCDP